MNPSHQHIHHPPNSTRLQDLARWRNFQRFRAKGTIAQFRRFAAEIGVDLPFTPSELEIKFLSAIDEEWSRLKQAPANSP